MKKEAAIKIIIIIAIALFFSTLIVNDISAVKKDKLEVKIYLSETATDDNVQNTATPHTTVTSSVKPVSTPTPVPTPTMEPYTEIVIGAVGDIMVHDRQVNDAYMAGERNGYSFYHWFEYIKPALLYPDLMIANLEGPIAGSEDGYNGYPRFNFPDEIVPAMMDAGIDVALNANNHIFDRNMEGLARTLEVLDDYGMNHTGVWSSKSERNKPLVLDVSGIKVGIVSATYSLNGFEKGIDDEVLEWLVCYIEPEQVKEQIDLCREYGAEVVIVCPHMGDELVKTPRSEMQDYAHSYIEMGADIVFACHPHVLQPAEMYDTVLEDGSNHTGIIYYSLGNFVSGMYGVSKETGAVAYVTLRRDNASGDISIKNAEYLPTSTLRYGNFEGGDLYHILPIGQCLDFPEMIEDISPNRSCFYRLQCEWDIAIDTLGDDVVKVLRYMPEEANETND